MPTTYNGVGTHYYGKKNAKSRQAVCQHCGHQATLSSYETRLWFVVIFIPVIPLGRRRVWDLCSVCSRHYSMSAHQWETDRQNVTSAAMDRFRSEPSEETALDVHGSLMAFQQLDEAASFRDSMLDRFPDHALLRAGLAGHLEHSGLIEQADPLWDEAIALDPDLPEAKAGKARRLLRDGNPDDARPLLAFLEQPGAEQQYDMMPLFELAQAFQNRNDHEQTLQLCERLLEINPDAAKDHSVRQFIRKSEKAARREESILPPVTHSVRGLFTSQYSSGLRWTAGIAAALLLAGIGMAINNEYIRRNRSLIVINETGVPAGIRVDNLEPVSVSGMQTLSVAEGSHTIRVSGPLDEQHAVRVESGYWDRWFRNPVWIVNVGGEAILADMTVYYAVQPREPAVRLTASPLIVRPDVDYAFEEPPDSMQLDNERQVLSKSAISWVALTEVPNPGPAAFDTLNSSSPAEAWSYAERRLSRVPDDVDLLAMLENSVNPATASRFRTLLESQLDRRPVLVEWHRAYQEQTSVRAEFENLTARYEAMRQKEPNSAPLLYLRARIEPDPALAEQTLQEALAADAEFSWAHYSLGYTRMCQGDWKAARDRFEEASRLEFPADGIPSALHTACLGLRQFDDLKSSYGELLRESPADISVGMLLSEIHTVEGNIDEAERVARSVVSAFRTASGDRQPEMAGMVEAMLMYLKGKAAAASELCGDHEMLRGVGTVFALEAGQRSEYVDSFEYSVSPADRWTPLYCALSFYADGNTAEFDAWYERQREQLRRTGPEIQPLTDILDSEPVTTDIVHQLASQTIPPMTKAAVYTALGLRSESPEIRTDFFDAARSLLVRRVSPYLLLSRILDLSDDG